MAQVHPRWHRPRSRSRSRSQSRTRPALTLLLPAGTEKSRGVQALAVSPNRRYLAVSETVADQPVLAVSELSEVPARRRRTLAAAELPAREVVSLAFSPDCRYLAAITLPPEGHLTYWLWEKQRLMAAVPVEALGSSVCQEKTAYFTYLNFPLHSASITGLDICFWKPILATCSLDRSVRIWNYKMK
ncbi:cilia- and flagella-associated protein 57 [Limosa lapponica baueri]|uniref:Cilia-and flagella-associated protein 57 n=1 Tax=Limosa lapponica baueri TaxID=1758121 RepID=A0A2I0T3K5_LIMLA|nr:cilia- and flagella-associated protein 57 [Limosa lapponica baueri]